MTPIRIYGADLRQIPAAACFDLLDESETRRAAAIKIPSAKMEFVKTRALLRLVLAANSPGMRPHDFTFETEANGKPYLAGHTALHFNVSHSHDMALIAVAAFPIGIDIEFQNETVDHLDVAESVFSASERDILRENFGDARRDTFFTLWARKEAYLKATGIGFSARLDQISTIQPTGIVEDLSQNLQTTTWHVIDLPVSNGYKAALVTNTNEIDVSIQTISGDEIGLPTNPESSQPNDWLRAS
jgi:4'-phosphopantetheinyl transferase